jgi:GH3 auxin-responsive promoter
MSMRQLVRHSVNKLLRFLLVRVGKVVATPVRLQLAKFEAGTHRPRELQQALLHDILRFQADTAFGRDHRFADARTVDDFRRRVPVAGYDYVEPYLARVRRGEANALLGDPRVLMFALTSGTTAARKYIPVTPQYLADYRRGWNLWGLKVYRDHDSVKMSRIVQLSGDWDEFRTEGGIPCGSVTGLTATAQKRLIRWLYCVPPVVGKVKDAAAKYYLALRLSLPRRVGMIIAASPSTVVNVARAGDRDKEHLLRDLADGTLSRHVDIPQEVRVALARRLKRHPERVRELEAIISRTGTLYPKDYWPGECLLGNWTGGSMGAYLRHYPRYFGKPLVRDVGLIASEGRMTIPLENGTPSGVLDISTHYYEFIPEAEADSHRPTVLGAHELREGGRYFILLTTSYGLYRYHIYDLVRVTGFYNSTPLIEFLSKGSSISSIAGEKLSEYQVAHATADALRELDTTVSCYSLAPCWDDEMPYYGLFVERGDMSEDAATNLAKCLDIRLCEANIEYASKRETKRLGAVVPAWVKSGFWQEWDRERLQRSGGAPEQYKHPCLITDPQFATGVKPAVRPSPRAVPN